MTINFSPLLLRIVLTGCLLASNDTAAKVYLTQNEFIDDLRHQIPSSQFHKKNLWLKANRQQQIKAILGHAYPKIRLSYRWAWVDNQIATLWFLDEIGKERPISFALWIQADQVKKIRVLAFRETRGGEIAMPAFEQQFNNNPLDKNGYFKNNIDGITGATLSVRAMKKVSKLALYLHQLVINKETFLVPTN